MPEETQVIETEETRPSGVENATKRFAALTQFEDQKTPESEEKKSADVTPEAKPEEKPEVKAADVAPSNEPKPALDDAPPGNVVGKAAESWNAFKAKANKEIATHQARVAELQREVETAKKSAQPVKIDESPEYVALKKRFEDLDSEMKTVAIERHPQFREYFGAKTKQAIDTAKSVVGTELAPRLERILKTGDPELRAQQVREFASELEPYQQAELATAMAGLRSVEAERSAEIEKAGKSYETLQAKTKAEQEQTTAQQRANAERAKTESLALARETMDAFKLKDGDEAHNAAVKQNEALVTSFFDGTIDRKVLPTIPALAAEAMHLRQTEIPRLQAELKKRDDIIAKYQGASPKLENGGAETREVAAPAGSKFLSKMQELWPGAQK